MGPMAKLAAAMRAEAVRRGELPPSDICESAPGPGPSGWRVEPDDTCPNDDSPDDSRPDDRHPIDSHPGSRLIDDGGVERSDDFFPSRDNATAYCAPADIQTAMSRRIPLVAAFILGGIIGAAGGFVLTYIAPWSSLDEPRTPGASVAIRLDDPARTAFSVTDPPSVKPTESSVSPPAEPANDVVIDPAMMNEPWDPYAVTPAVPSALPSSPPVPSSVVSLAPQSLDPVATSSPGAIPGRSSVSVLAEPDANPAPPAAEPAEREGSARGDQPSFQRGGAPALPAALSPPADPAVATAPPAATTDAPTPAQASPDPSPRAVETTTSTAPATGPKHKSAAPQTARLSGSAPRPSISRAVPPRAVGDSATMPRVEAAVAAVPPGSQGPPIDIADLPPLYLSAKSDPSPGSRAISAGAAAVGLHGPTSIAPVRTTAAASPSASEAAGDACESYTAPRTLLGQPRQVSGLACRASSGEWQIISQLPR